MITYIIYWKSGEYELVRGTSIADAFRRAGYGAGALRALDFYAEGTDIQYTFTKGAWVKND